MDHPKIEFVNPTSRAMGRMTTILFRPFDLGKWLVLGFTAWLASFMEGGGSSVNNQVNVGGGEGRGGASHPLEEFIGSAETFVKENLEWIVPLAIVGAILLLALGIVLLWIGSRGKFLFLDNVVHNRALVKQPWREFRALGNSLFRWRLGFFLVSLGVLLAVGGLSAFLLASTFEGGNIGPGWFAGLAISVGVVLALIVAIAYIAILLEHFVVPLMYRYSFRATESWQRVRDLHRGRAGFFILFALWNLLLSLAALLAIVAGILITCCVGGILLAIPYLGAVLLLPVSVFFRALGPEFLRQFGGEYDLWTGGGDPFGFEAESMPQRGGY